MVRIKGWFPWKSENAMHTAEIIVLWWVVPWGNTGIESQVQTSCPTFLSNIKEQILPLQMLILCNKTYLVANISSTISENFFSSVMKHLYHSWWCCQLYPLGVADVPKVDHNPCGKAGWQHLQEWCRCFIAELKKFSEENLQIVKLIK